MNNIKNEAGDNQTYYSTHSSLKCSERLTNLDTRNLTSLAIEQIAHDMEKIKLPTSLPKRKNSPCSSQNPKRQRFNVVNLASVLLSLQNFSEEGVVVELPPQADFSQARTSQERADSSLGKVQVLKTAWESLYTLPPETEHLDAITSEIADAEIKDQLCVFWLSYQSANEESEKAEIQKKCMEWIDEIYFNQAARVSPCLNPDSDSFFVPKLEIITEIIPIDFFIEDDPNLEGCKSLIEKKLNISLHTPERDELSFLIAFSKVLIEKGLNPPGINNPDRFTEVLVQEMEENSVQFINANNDLPNSAHRTLERLKQFGPGDLRKQVATFPLYIRSILFDVCKQEEGLIYDEYEIKNKINEKLLERFLNQIHSSSSSDYTEVAAYLTKYEAPIQIIIFKYDHFSKTTITSKFTRTDLEPIRLFAFPFLGAYKWCLFSNRS